MGQNLFKNKIKATGITSFLREKLHIISIILGSCFLFFGRVLYLIFDEIRTVFFICY